MGLLLFLSVLVSQPALAQQQVRVTCPGNYPAGSLQDYMCDVREAESGAKILFSIQGALADLRGGVGTTNVTREYYTEPNAENTMASMAKIMTAYMAFEMLASQHDGHPALTQNYKQTGINLDTKVRVVRDPQNYRNSAQAFYVGPGFASAPCARPDEAPNSWGGSDRFNAKFSFYDPAKQGTNEDYSVSVRALIELTMVRSSNDAAILLGALVAHHLAVNRQRPFSEDTHDHEMRTRALSGALTATGNINGSSHGSWIPHFAEEMNASARAMVSSANSNVFFCAASGWSVTGSAGCTKPNKARPIEFGRLAQEIHRRAGNLPIRGSVSNLGSLGPNPRYSAFLALTSTTQSFNTRLRNSNGSCVIARVESALPNTASGLILSSASSSGGSNIKLVKTGSINAPENLVAVADTTSGSPNDPCSGLTMTAVLMRPSGQAANNRQIILGNILQKGAFTATNGRCNLPYREAAIGEAAALRRSAGMSAEAMALIEANYASFESPADTWAIAILEPAGAGRDGAGTGTAAGPSVELTSNATDEECAPEVRWAERWGQQVKEAHQFGIAERLVDGMVDRIFGQQCVGRLIDLMQQVMGAVDTVRTIAASADMMSAVVAAAAGAIVRAILDQVFQWITNAICTITDTIIGAIDNISKNLLCFKNPLFSVPNKPFEIPIDIEAISCSGLAINPLYFSGDPNQPLGRGNIAGLELSSVKAGDRPFFCPTGTRLAQRTEQGTEGRPVQRYFCERENVQRINCTPPMRPNGRGGCEAIPFEESSLPRISTPPASQCPPGEIMGVNGCAPAPGN